MVFFIPSLSIQIPFKSPSILSGKPLLFGKVYFRTVMKKLPLILGFQLTVRLPEIIIFQLGALVLGFTIHYFLNVKKTIRIEKPSEQEGISENDNWKLKYYNDMDLQEKTLENLRKNLDETRENEQILNIELEEAQKEIKNLRERLHAAEQLIPKKTSSADDYLNQLKSAQENLFQHNQHVNRLLEQIQLLKESEKKYLDLQKVNTDLNLQISDLNQMLANKENEVSHLRQQQRLSEELAERLDKAYTEYNVLHGKLQKLEGYLAQPQSRSIEYEELHNSYFRLTRDFDEAKSKQIALWEENQRLSRILADTEDKLREANFQRQQLQKKMTFLEELNRDLQEASEHNKKLEGQLRRISEMEAMLSRAMHSKNDPGRPPGSI